MTKEKEKTKTPKIRIFPPEEEQNKVLSEALKKQEAMENWRKQGCWYDPNTSNIDSRWKRDDELYLMISEIDTRGWADTASAALYKNIQTLESEFHSLDFIDRIKVYSAKDVGRNKLVENIIKITNDKNGTKYQDCQTATNTFKYGKAYQVVEWLNITSEYPQVKKKEKLSDKEKLGIEKGVLPYEIKKYTEFDDVDVYDIHPSKVYIEPGAVHFYGRRKRANYGSIVEWISYEDFLRESKLPGFITKNKDKIKTSGTDTGSTFWNAPENQGKEGQVKRTRFFDRVNLRELVIYNNILGFIKPLSFGAIPIVDYSFFNIKDEHYVPGLGALLDPLIREQNSTRNDILNRIKLDNNPPVYVDSMVASEISSGGERLELGEFVPITGLQHMGTNAIMPHPIGQARMQEALAMLSSLEENIVEISGVNPRRHGSLQRSYNATEVQIVDSATAKTIDLFFSRFYEGRAERTKLQIKWMQQEYTKEMAMDRNGEKLEKPKKRVIALEGVKYELDKTDREKWIEQQIEGFSELELDKKVFDLDDNYKVYPDPEVMRKLTKDIERRMWEQILPQLVPLSNDPRYLQPGQPPAPCDITKLLKGYTSAHEIDVMSSYDLDIDKEVEEAHEQNDKIIKGEFITGHPGEPLEHVQIHEQAMMIMEKDMDDRRKLVPPLDPIVAQRFQAMGQIPPKTAQEQAIEEMEQRLKYLKYHIDIDRKTVGSPVPMFPETNKMGGMNVPIGRVTGATPPQMPGGDIVPPPVMGGMMG